MRYCGHLKDIFRYVGSLSRNHGNVISRNLFLFERSSDDNSNIQANFIVEYNNMETIFDTTNAKACYMVESEFNVINDLQAFVVEYNVA